MSLIIGTAGHIDHGKTSLVKALTGQDTDRLKEEKERGISIDLGFAYLDLPDGTRAGLVDVPGHERFIRNMLAGAHGIDVVLFTVAADDGVMPQTVEHLDIVHLLRVPKAIFVITKCDVVSASRLREVEDQIRGLATGTQFERAPILPCSCVTGEGLDALRDLIAGLSRDGHHARGRGHFRLPIDRVFLLHGHGLVVTGTATGGTVRGGDLVRCLPGSQLLRVRSVHVHNQAVDAATAGQRVALNLTGLERPALTRGHVVASEALTLTSDRFDAWIELRPSAVHGLKDHQRVRVHMGTAERLATARLVGVTGPVLPNGAAYCQFVLAAPLHTLRGDRFVVRDETGQRTLGGGVVVHPWPRTHQPQDADGVRRLEQLRLGSPPEVLRTFLEDSPEFGVAGAVLAQLLDVEEADLPEHIQLCEAVRAIRLDGASFFTTVDTLQRLRRRLASILQAYHQANPLAVGMDAEALRDAVNVPGAGRGPSVADMPIDIGLFRAAVDQHCGDIVVREGSRLRLSAHRVVLDDANASTLERVRSLLAAQPLAPPSLSEVAVRLSIPKQKLIEMVRLLEREGAVVRVAADLCFEAAAVAAAQRTLHERWTGQVPIPTAEFRDVVGTSRKFAIPLLEYFDRVGVTSRVGEVRTLRQGPALTSGAAIGNP